MKTHPLLIYSCLVLAAALCQASVIPATPGVALAPVPPVVPVAGSHQFVARNFNRLYPYVPAWHAQVPTLTPAYAPYPTPYYPNYPTYSKYPTTTYYPPTYKYGGTYPYSYNPYFPSYNYGYSYTGGVW